MKKLIPIILLLAFSATLDVRGDFEGGPVSDSRRQAILTRIKTINQNILNQFNSLKGTEDQKLAVLLAISRCLGTASPAELNPSLEIPENSQVNVLAEAIEARFKDSPEDFVIYDAISRYRDMNQRLTVYGEYLEQLSKRGSETLNITERQRVKAELGYLESRIKLDRDMLQNTTKAENLMLKHKAADIRAIRYADKKLDEALE
jgi:hypothetical protein